MNINEKFAITISREVGTGGRTVGRELAKRLGVRYCDKELIKKLKEMFGLNEAEIERIKGKKQNWLEDLFSRITPEFGSEMFIPKSAEYAPDVTSNLLWHHQSSYEMLCRQYLQSIHFEFFYVSALFSAFNPFLKYFDKESLTSTQYRYLSEWSHHDHHEAIFYNSDISSLFLLRY